MQISKKTILISIIAIAMLASLPWAGGPTFAPGGDQSYAAGRTAATIKVSKSHYDKYPSSKPFLLKATTNSNGKLKYMSGNQKVATISRKGKVTIHGVGSATITISVPKTKKYKAASTTVKVRVAKKQILTLKKTLYKKDLKSKDFKIAYTTNAKPLPALTCSSSDPQVVTVDDSGKVSIAGLGTATVTLHSAGNAKFYAAKAAVTVKVSKCKQTITTGKDSYTIGTLNKTCNLNAATTSQLALTYASSDKTIVKVTKKGLLKPVALGTAQITVSQAGDDIYKPAVKIIPITVRKPTAKEGREAAVEWAIQIANDNSFAYGSGSRAHRKGCYFCGTNTGPVRKIKEQKGEKHYVKDSNGKKHTYEKTYCCNPFVHAAYAHGAQNEAMLKDCKKGYGVNLDDSSFLRYGCWKKLKKSKYSFDKLKRGDVFVQKGRHVSIYCGGEDVVEAASGNWSSSSITVRASARSRYSSSAYVMRYTGE